MYKNFLKGFKYWFRGFYFLLKHPLLLRYMIIPLIINFVIVVLLFWAGWNTVTDLLPDASFVFSGENLKWWVYIFAFIKALFIFIWKFLLKIVAIITLMVVSVFVYVFLAGIVGAPFYDKLSFEVEKKCGIKTEEMPFTFKNSILYPVLNSIKTAFFEIIIVIFAFPLNYVPIIGSIIYIHIVSFPLSIGLLGYSAERRLLPFKKILSLSWANRSLMTGFGVMSFISMIPFGLNMITFPISAVAGSLLFIEVIDEGNESLLLSKKG